MPERSRGDDATGWRLRSAIVNDGAEVYQLGSALDFDDDNPPVLYFTGNDAGTWLACEHPERRPDWDVRYHIAFKCVGCRISAIAASVTDPTSDSKRICASMVVEAQDSLP